MLDEEFARTPLVQLTTTDPRSDLAMDRKRKVIGASLALIALVLAADYFGAFKAPYSLVSAEESKEEPLKLAKQPKIYGKYVSRYELTWPSKGTGDQVLRAEGRTGIFREYAVGFLDSGQVAINSLIEKDGLTGFRHSRATDWALRNDNWAIRCARYDRDKFIEALGHVRIGMIMYLKAQDCIGEGHFQLASSLIEQLESKEQQQRALIELADCYHRLNAFDCEKSVLERLLPVATAVNGAQSEVVAVALNRLGNCQSWTGEVEKADTTYRQCLTILKTKPLSNLVEQVECNLETARTTADGLPKMGLIKGIPTRGATASPALSSRYSRSIELASVDRDGGYDQSEKALVDLKYAQAIAVLKDHYQLKKDSVELLLQLIEQLHRSEADLMTTAVDPKIAVPSPSRGVRGKLPSARDLEKQILGNKRKLDISAHDYGAGFPSLGCELAAVYVDDPANEFSHKFTEDRKFLDVLSMRVRNEFGEILQPVWSSLFSEGGFDNFQPSPNKQLMAQLETRKEFIDLLSGELGKQAYEQHEKDEEKRDEHYREIVTSALVAKGVTKTQAIKAWSSNLGGGTHCNIHVSPAHEGCPGCNFNDDTREKILACWKPSEAVATSSVNVAISPTGMLDEISIFDEGNAESDELALKAVLDAVPFSKFAVKDMKGKEMGGKMLVIFELSNSLPSMTILDETYRDFDSECSKVALQALTPALRKTLNKCDLQLQVSREGKILEVSCRNHKSSPRDQLVIQKLSALPMLPPLPAGMQSPHKFNVWWPQ